MTFLMRTSPPAGGTAGEEALHGGHIGARLDLVGDDGVGAPPQAGDAPDLDDVGAGSHDVGSHGVEEVGQIHDVGLLGGVFDDGEPLGQGGGQHDVHGGAHRHHVQIDLGAGQPPTAGGGVDIAPLDLHVGPHGHKALDVLVDGPSAEVTAPGERYLRGAKPPQQRSNQIIAGPNFSSGLIGYLAVDNMGAVHIYCGAVDSFHLCP